MAYAEVNGVGDGITDDRNAIVNAMTAAGPNGIVHFPEGTYLCKNLLPAANGQTWLLDKNATLKCGPNITAGDSLIAGNCSDFTIDGGTFDASTLVATQSDRAIFFGRLSSGLTIKNAKIVGPLADPNHNFKAVYVSGSSNVALHNLDIVHGGIFISSYSSAGPTTCRGISVTDCTLDNTGQDADYSGGLRLKGEEADDFLRDVVVRGNIVKRDMINVAGSAGPENYYVYRCSGIVIDHNISDGGFFGFSTPYITCGSMIGNVVRDFSTFGIEVIGVSGVAVCGNFIDPGDGPGTPNTNVAGVSLAGAPVARVTLSGNVVRNCARAVMSGSHGGTDRNVTVTGNVFDFNGASAYSMHRGWDVNSPLVNGIFANNVIDGYSTSTTNAFVTWKPLYNMTINGNVEIGRA